MNVVPNNEDAERAVLSCMLLDQNVIPSIIENLTEDYFYFQINKKIYSAIYNLFQKNKPVDILTISHELKKDGSDKDISSYLSELLSFLPTSSNVNYYIEILRDNYIRRSLIYFASRLDKQSREEKDLNNVINFLQKEAFSISTTSINHVFYDAKTLIEMQMDRADQFAKNPNMLRGISTGFDTLDQVLQGLHKSDLIIIAARPSVGKSAFAFDIARHVAVQEKKTVAIFSLEMPAVQVIERMLSQQTGINLWNIRMGKLSDNEYIKYNVGASQIGESKIYIDETSGINISQIRAKTMKLMLEKGLDLLVIDYLQLMQGSSANIENRALEVGEISRSLKILARELNIPIIALSQLNRAVESRQDKTPQLSDLRESGSIEQDADIVIFLARDVVSDQKDAFAQTNSENSNKIKVDVIIAKHRNGPTGKINLYFIPEQTKFIDM
ncbi:MAG: replicative DNA helicase [Candidatus Dojkabacteria bacterium]|nr:replicative DNA helicase [Candidatus Dojkabacteria bacterium]